MIYKILTICKILTISKIQVICSNILNVYRTNEPSFSVVDVHDMHVPLLALWGWHVPPYDLDGHILDHILNHDHFFCFRWSSFAIWTNSSSTNVASISCGDDATSGTTGGVDGTFTDVIGVSSTCGGLMSINGVSLRTDVCLVLLVWAPPPLVRTYLDWVMDDIDYWWGSGLMSIDGCAQATTGVCLIFLMPGPRPIGRTCPDWGWGCVVTSTLNGASKRFISCMASNTVVHSLQICKSFGAAVSYLWCMLVVYKSNRR